MQSSVVFSVFVMTTQICELDGKILSGARSVYSHNKLHFNEEHKCSICTKSFATQEYLNLHHKNVHSEATYNCNECEEVFRIKKNLKRHIENLHLKVEYCCEICGKKFPRQDTFLRTMMDYPNDSNIARANYYFLGHEMRELFEI